MSKEYYKKKIIDLRASIAREKEQKKKDNEYYARQIKNATSPSSIDKAASHDSDIEYYKRQSESAKEALARLRR